MIPRHQPKVIHQILHPDRSFRPPRQNRFDRFPLRLRHVSPIELLSNALTGFDVRNYDPCIPEYATPPSPAELVVCTDVLEHIEPDKLDAVLNDIIRLSSKGAFLVAANAACQEDVA